MKKTPFEFPGNVFNRLFTGRLTAFRLEGIFQTFPVEANDNDLLMTNYIRESEFEKHQERKTNYLRPKCLQVKVSTRMNFFATQFRVEIFYNVFALP